MKKSPSRIASIASLLLSLLALVIAEKPALAQETDISGEWLAEISDQNSSFLNYERWTLLRNGPTLDGTTAYIGSGSNGSITWTSVSALQGLEFSQVNTYNSNPNFIMTYTGSVDAAATVISGSWVDSNATQGSYIAHRVTPIEFKPGTPLTEAPHITIVGDDITVTMEKFTKALPKGSRKAARVPLSTTAALAAKASRISISYEVSIKGSTRQQTRKTIISKRNQVTVRNLVPGNYTSSYKVKAIQDEKVIYSSKASPKTIFVVR